MQFHGQSQPKEDGLFSMERTLALRCVSAADLRAFLSKVGNNQAIRDHIHAATGVDDILTIAEKHGFNLSKPAVLRAHGEALAQAEDAQLQRVNTWGDALIHCFGVTDSD